MSKLLGLITLTLIALATADFPYSWEWDLGEDLTKTVSTRNDDNVYRLPETIIPLEYDIYLDLYFGERTDRPYSFDGTEYIIIQAAEANVTQIVLHANVDSINGVSVLDSTGLPLTLNQFEPFALEPEYHFLKVNLNEALLLNVNYTLHIDYSNTMNEGPMKRGIWKGWYIDYDGSERIYAATHFQPYNARQAFPCWDEPLFKSVFTLHISRPSNFLGTYTNTYIQSVSLQGGGRVRDNFQQTPKMSAYLVTFLVSETLQVVAEDTTFTPPIRLIGRFNDSAMGAHSLRLATEMTEFFDNYFGIPYASMHPNLRNDHIVSPDWASAGTENWGMVSYRELYLIINSSETLMSVEQYATTLVSHELAHKWFGNLITCFWWSNTWINEGFASYFGYIAGHEKFPEYELHEHFNSRYLQGSLAYDSSASSEPMNHEVNTPAQVTGHFGTISYSKGASFLRMIVDMITDDTFRKACNYFLTENAYEPTDQYDLYNAFERAITEDNALAAYPNFNFSEYYRIWVNEPGYPVLDVDVDFATGEITLTQSRFFLSATATPTGQIYSIPITYSTRSNPDFGQLRPTVMMSTETITINKEPGTEWVIFNNLQHGHYRVNYNDANWQLIIDTLLTDPSSIHYLNRAQIVDDVFAFMRSGKLSYNFGFNILRFLSNESNYHVWDPAITGYTWLRNRLRHLPAEQAEFDSFVLGQMEHVISIVGFDAAANETPTDTLNRQVILHFACLLGHEQCVTESRNRFIAMRDNGLWIHPGIRRNVLTSGIRQGNQADFQFLLNRFHIQSDYANDQLEILRGLAATRDSGLLTQYLELTLDDKIVRAHDKVNAFNYALLGNTDNAPTILQFVKNHIDDIRISYIEDSPPRPVQSVLTNLAAYLDEPGLVEMEEWLTSTQSNTAQYATTLSSIAAARTNMAWGTANAQMILSAARGGANSVMTSFATVAFLAVVAIFNRL